MEHRCENSECQCNADNRVYNDMEIFLSILETMSEKVKLYTSIMQNRLAMIREDIVSAILEETLKFQIRMVNGICSIRSCVNYIENSETFPQSQEDLAFIQKFYNPAESMQLFGIQPLQFNLDSEELQEGFNRALAGEYVEFRRLIMRRDN